MKYIIMCGGDYKLWSYPRQLIKINNEPIVVRTIRLLRECGVTDIAISSNNSVFDQFEVPVLNHDNQFDVFAPEQVDGTWCNAFYFTDCPVCYLFGDVVFSKAAIQKIVETPTDDIEFFASAPPFSSQYKKPHAEPFAFKVTDVSRFKACVQTLKDYETLGMFYRHPIAWELWQVIKDTPLNNIDYTNYTVINDYTCDIDSKEDIRNFIDIDLEK